MLHNWPQKRFWGERFSEHHVLPTPVKSTSSGVPLSASARRKWMRSCVSDWLDPRVQFQNRELVLRFSKLEDYTKQKTQGKRKRSGLLECLPLVRHSRTTSGLLGARWIGVGGIRVPPRLVRSHLRLGFRSVFLGMINTILRSFSRLLASNCSNHCATDGMELFENSLAAQHHM